MTIDYHTPKALEEELTVLRQRLVELERTNLEQQQTVEQLQQKLHLVQSLIDALPSPIYVKDREQRFLFVNTSTSKLLGMQPADMVGKTDTDLFGAENAAAWRESQLQPFATGQVSYSEDYAMLPDGEHIYLAMKFPLYDLHGTIFAMGGISTDITALKKAETALRENQVLLRGILDNSPAAIFVKAYDGRFLMVNKNTSVLVGLTPDAMVGKADYELFDPENVKAWREAEHKVFHTGKVLVSRDPAQLADGLHTYLSIKFPLYDAEEKIYATGAISTDITEITRAEEERAAMQQQIIEVQQTALRELSTPLIPISDTVVIMPLVGTIDSQRAQQVMETLLEGVATHRAETVILDITGVQIVDTQVAQAFVRAAQAVKLLGAEVMMTGIRPQIAQTLVHLGVDLGGIMTHASLQAGISKALKDLRGR